MTREEWNKRWNFFYHFSGLAMDIYKEYKFGMGIEIYTGLLEYLISREGYPVERGMRLPMYWGDDVTGATCGVDFLIRSKKAAFASSPELGSIMVETYSQAEVSKEERVHIQNLMRLTHCQYGMLLNFSPEQLYSEWYHRDPETGIIDKIKLIK